ncbi:MAG: CoB--CoM heterodisulfide reductase iron-sulfur subunit B family protein [Calditrichaeota bacterium]|nr:CoB--CoM heterodisulfide reductase iron-sulfur subunit B family protein [Calditrichota bacterium]
MKYALFLGCTVPIRSQNYEVAVRAVAARLGIELVDVEDFSCCGFPVKSTNAQTTLLMAARNLAVAEEQGLDVCCLCSACSAVLTETNLELQQHPELLRQVNRQLRKIKRQYRGSVKVKHFARILYEDYGLEDLRRHVTRPLTALKLAPHYGCHFVRPKGNYDAFDDPEAARSLDELVAVTGAEVIRYETKKYCCGGAILGVEQTTALGLSGLKLSDVRAAGADALISICPFCSVLYEDNQKKVEEQFQREIALPVFFYPQVLGLAMGYDPKDLGFRLNKVRPDEVLAKVLPAAVA